MGFVFPCFPSMVFLLSKRHQFGRDNNSDTPRILSCCEFINTCLFELSTRGTLYETWHYYAIRNKYWKCIIFDKWNENCENVTAFVLTDRRIVFRMQASQLRQQSSVWSTYSAIFVCEDTIQTIYLIICELKYRLLRRVSTGRLRVKRLFSPWLP